MPEGLCAERDRQRSGMCVAMRVMVGSRPRTRRDPHRFARHRRLSPSRLARFVRRNLGAVLAAASADLLQQTEPVPQVDVRGGRQSWDRCLLRGTR